MARCGIRLRYPVMVVRIDDEGRLSSPAFIGEAETLPQAIALAESEGFAVRERENGGASRFITGDGAPYFLVTAYPE